MIFQRSLDKRIIPRASVLQFLTSKGLRKKKAAISRPFAISEELFLDRFVKCFKEDSSHLLKLYEEKMNLADNREKKSLPGV
jgi:mTERF domain-containing protein, mitochondrial